MQKIRKILFPFSWLYGGVVWLRNKFFDWNLIPSKAYDFPVICIGNLSVGGTGKSPMTEYLIRLLIDNYKIATLSRGYGRVTKGFYRLTGEEEAAQTGDEPLQFKTKFADVEVAVDEDRQHGIAQLRSAKNPPELIILDDAYQHRKVTPGFAILLTAYSKIYAEDMVLPAGDLREPRAGAKRANIIVVTKCPKDLPLSKRDRISRNLNLNENQSLFFSYIAYSETISNQEKEIALKELPKGFLLVTGIAKPKPLVSYLKQKELNFRHQAFPDHHNFSEDEIEKMNQAEFILTTEKDYMRLKSKLPNEKLYYLPITHQFIENGDRFDEEITNWVESQLK